MRRAVADTAGVRQVEGVDLHHRKPAAADLRRHLRLEPVEHRQFLDLHAVEPLQIRRRELEEGEVVALEVLRHGEAEGGGRFVAGRMEHLDQEIDIAVRLRPEPLGVVQPARLVGSRVETAHHLPHAHAPQSAWRTFAGHAPTSAP